MGLNSNKSNTTITSTLFVVYLIALIWILLFKLGVNFSYGTNRQFNLVPFREYVLYDTRIDRMGTILNILVFIPLGIYISALFNSWSFFSKTFICLMASLIIESFQYILAIGAFDITDIITNTTGGIIGIIIFHLFERSMGNRNKAIRVINIFATIGTIGMIILLLMLKMDMLPIRYR